MRRIALIVMALWPVVAYAQDIPNPPSNLKDPKMIKAGHDLFDSKQCSQCHGADGQGGINLVQRDLADVPPRFLFDTIANGREKNGIRMPAWRGVLTDEQIWSAIAWVQSISHK
jgi:mono/diheme cytochrome c family protein